MPACSIHLAKIRDVVAVAVYIPYYKVELSYQPNVVPAADLENAVAFGCFDIPAQNPKLFSYVVHLLYHWKEVYSIQGAPQYLSGAGF